MKRVIGVVSVSAGFVAITTWYRPLPDYSEDGNGPQRNQFEFISKRSMTDIAGEREPLALNLARRMSAFINISVFRFLMTTLGEVRVNKDRQYEAFLESVVNRQNQVPLITVSNHRSMADDPGAMSCLLPYWTSIQPKYLRWSLCAQDYCFNKKFPQFFYGLCGSFKVLPMWRGGGVNQKLLWDYFRLCAAGEWLHLFPEGGVWQLDALGGRFNSKLGKLKWGVGKLIAHSPVSPIVMPIFIAGTEAIVPQDPNTKKPLFGYPLPGHSVNLRVGKRIYFDDLIAEHEKRYGPLRKFSIESEFPSSDSSWFHEHWDSKAHEYELYSQITSRIEQELEQLGQESRAELF